MLFIVQFTLLVVVIKHASGLTCLSNESKDDFDKSRKALTDVQKNIGRVLNKLENDNKKTLDMFKETINTMGQKIKKLDNDFKVLGKDFRKTKWHKYNGHCYYYSSDRTDWFTAERKCREIGGYLVKIDDKEENGNITSHRPSNDNTNYNLIREWHRVHTLHGDFDKWTFGLSDHYWIGLIDLKEGIWRWTYDQSKAGFKAWHSGYGSQGTGSNCVMLYSNAPDWFDYDCHYKSARYVCESNFCF